MHHHPDYHSPIPSQVPHLGTYQVPRPNRIPSNQIDKETEAFLIQAENERQNIDLRRRLVWVTTISLVIWGVFLVGFLSSNIDALTNGVCSLLGTVTVAFVTLYGYVIKCIFPRS